MIEFLLQWFIGWAMLFDAVIWIITFGLIKLHVDLWVAKILSKYRYKHRLGVWKDRIN